MIKLQEKLEMKRRECGGLIPDPLIRLRQELIKWKGREQVNTFYFKEISIGETEMLVKGLGKSRSFGPDGIDADFLKIILPEVIQPLTFLVNLSLRTSSWPIRWKTARVMPLLKDKSLNKMLPESYRPVSLLPTLSKVAERAAQVQLLEFFEKSGQLSAAGHAYRKSLSTTTTITAIVDELYQATEDGMIYQLMTIDQSAAFDCISHKILIRKLEEYKVSAEVRKWVENYLNFRSQYVTVGAADSFMTSQDTGVPQGSVMGPILYAIYVNEMSVVVKDDECLERAHHSGDRLFGETCQRCGIVNIYADDATYNVSGRKREGNMRKIAKTLGEMETFLLENQLHLNVGKTTILECMIPQKRGKTPGPPPQLVVKEDDGTDKVILDTGQCQVLGTNLQSNMSWFSHLESGKNAVLPKVRRQLGALQSLGTKIPRNCRKILANGFILSKLMYLIPAWGSTTDNQVRRAQVLMNKTARWVIGQRRRTRVIDLMKETGWLTVKEMNITQSCILMWKVLHLERPGHVRARLQTDNEWKLEIKNTRIQFTERGWRWKTSPIWNSLPDWMRAETKVSAFKRNMRTWILEKREQEPD